MQTYWKTKRENIPIKKPMKAMNARVSNVVAQLETLLTQEIWPCHFSQDQFDPF